MAEFQGLLLGLEESEKAIDERIRIELSVPESVT
jgi:hypothetical protein